MRGITTLQLILLLVSLTPATPSHPLWDSVPPLDSYTESTVERMTGIFQDALKICYRRNNSSLVSSNDCRIIMSTLPDTLFKVDVTTNNFVVMGRETAHSPGDRTSKMGYDQRNSNLGCKDNRDEYKDPNHNIWTNLQRNTFGACKFDCLELEGYRGVFKCFAGVALVVIAVMSSTRLVYMKFKRRRQMMTRARVFLQNGGTSLQKRLKEIGKSSDILGTFSLTDISEATLKYDESMIIGQGGSGTVYRGILRDNSVPVAIKVFRDIDETQIQQFINEVVILCQINHRHAVKILGCCLETRVPILVYELIENGSLYDWLHDQQKKHFLDWKLRLKIAAQTAGVLSYLHSAASTPIIHRDVKSTNILLDTDFSAKVADFGASRINHLNQTRLSTVVQGTIGYLDPEYMQTGQLTVKSDVYSFGVVLVELITGLKPLEGKRNLVDLFLKMLKKKLVSKVFDKTMCNNSNVKQVKKVAQLAEKCLNMQGEHRPNMSCVALELQKLIHPGEAKRDWKFW